MAEPRKVPFVTLSAFAGAPSLELKKRRREEEAQAASAAGGGEEPGAAGCGVLGKAKASGQADVVDGEQRAGVTVRLNLSLAEPSDHASAEFNYSELLQCAQVKKSPGGPTPGSDPNDPFGDEERERHEVEALAKKFESKYGSAGKKRRKDRMQDLIDIGFGYDESDPFIDNSEAYDELVPASLTTKLGGFYINTGTLQFRAASESEGEDGNKDGKPHKLKDGDEQVIKKRKKKEGSSMEEKKPRKNRVSKQGVTALNSHRPEKKKRKLMKDSLCLAAMLRRFNREKEEMRKKNASNVANTSQPSASAQVANAGVSAATLHNSHVHSNSNNDLSIADLATDPTMMSLLSSTNENELQDLLGDLDFGLLDSPQSSSPAQRENGLPGTGMLAGQKVGAGALGKGQGQMGTGSGILTPPPLPDDLPPPLMKRIEDLRVASRQFDQEGRKKFFTLDMNNILLDIELQVQEQPAVVRAAVYSHLEAFVPCNKEVLLKRLKKLSLNIQDDRLRAPLLKLKLAVCSVMPEQIAQYNMDCMAKAAKQQSEEGEKNGSEEDDEEKPGKRVMGPRKKFVWDDKLRGLLCSLVRVKLSCYELEGQSSLSVEDYLKAFLENEVKPLWPKGWMQARMLFKESRAVHSHLTGSFAKKKIVPTPKAKTKEGSWVQRTPPSTVATPSLAPPARRPPSSPSETICLSDSLDEDLTVPSLDSISHALALLSSAAKGLAQGDSVPSPPGSQNAPKMITSTPTPTPSLPQYSSPLTHSSLSVKKEATTVPAGNMNTLTTSTPSSSSSSCLPRPPSVSSASSPSVAARSDGFGMMKAAVGSLPQTQRPSIPSTHRPGMAGLNKLNPANSPSPPKPRPPPTASPLLPPQQKSFCPPGVKTGVAPAPSGLVKSSPKSSSNNGSSNSSMTVSPQSRLNSHPPQVNPKSPQTPRLSHCLSPATSPSHPQPKAHPHHQSNFITPMQATLTKSSHSSSSPIIKLTPRPPAPPPSSSPSSSPSVPPHSRPQAMPAAHQYSPKNAGFRPPFSVPGGSVKPAQDNYSPVGGQKAPPHSSNSSSGGGVTIPSSSSSIAGRPASSPSPTVSANHGQRPRSMAVSSQVSKVVTSRAPVPPLPTTPATSQLSQVSSASSSLLGTPTPPAPPSLPLGFGMLGGLVPVSLPFQFPSLLNFSTPGAAGTSGVGASAGNSSGYTLAQNLLKSLQSGSQAALPPHLQLAFSDANQSQGGDMTRKSH
ncbi:ubinuclein-2a isoform X2 [Scleropages formosus]|uniref:ubinuclein-2a isoform X2 n=1 Tax=Scleropages formosus TaxID=113540 RepID=UPI0010FA7912|nr:ubinuclein-2-like isoform X2 [Scleropages formosus]